MNECGYYSTYVQGCRCDKCKQANAFYQRKYRSQEKQRQANIRNAKRRNRAAMLALRHLKQHDKRAYFHCMDEARTWMENTTSN